MGIIFVLMYLLMKLLQRGTNSIFHQAVLLFFYVSGI